MMKVVVGIFHFVEVVHYVISSVSEGLNIDGRRDVVIVRHPCEYMYKSAYQECYV